MMEQKDIQGKALLDYFLGKEEVPLILHTSYGPPETMPVEVFYREPEDLSELEKLALRYCKGNVLDVGAGVGSIALELHEKGMKVTALEVSYLCCKIMEQRGVEQIVCDDVWEYSGYRFDTLLLLMNGLGLAGTLPKLPEFLGKLKTLLAPGGQIICDSSDISYLYRKGRKPAQRYFGEIDYCYEYEGEKGEWFSWLYIDVPMLSRICKTVGLQMEVIYRNRSDQYLARLKLQE